MLYIYKETDGPVITVTNKLNVGGHSRPPWMQMSEQIDRKMKDKSLNVKEKKKMIHSKIYVSVEFQGSGITM